MKRTTLLIFLSFIFCPIILLAQENAKVDSTDNKKIFHAKMEDTTPQNVAASDGSFENYILISWDAVTNAESYHIFRSTATMEDTAEEIELSKQKSISKTAIFDYDVVPGVYYHYWIAAESIFGVLNKSAEDDQGHIPAKQIYATPPPLLSDVNDDETILKWLPINNATQYRLQITGRYDPAWSTQTGFSKELILVDTIVNETQYLLNKLNESFQYYWSVQALDKEGQSHFSEVTFVNFSKEMIMKSVFPIDMEIQDFELKEGDKETVLLEGSILNNSAQSIEGLQVFYFTSEDERWNEEDPIVAKAYIGMLNENGPYKLSQQINSSELKKYVGVMIYFDSAVVDFKIIETK